MSISIFFVALFLGYNPGRLITISFQFAGILLGILIQTELALGDNFWGKNACLLLNVKRIFLHP